MPWRVQRAVQRKAGLVAIALVCGCTDGKGHEAPAASEAVEPPAPKPMPLTPLQLHQPAPDETARLLVPMGTPLYLGATGDEAIVPREEYERSPHGGPPPVVALRVGERVGDRLQVFTDDSEWGSCTVGAHWLRDIDLALFIDPDAVQPVTTRSVSARWPNGSWVVMTAGVPVRPPGKGRESTIEADGVQIRLELDKDAVGHTFVRAPSFDDVSEYDYLAPDTAIHFGRNQSVLSNRFKGVNGGAGVSDRRSAGRRQLVTVRGECIELRGHVDEVQTVVPTPGQDTLR